MFRRLLDHAAHARRAVARALPSQCAICHGWPAQPLCGDCVSRLAAPVWRCATCALPLPAGLVAAIDTPDEAAPDGSLRCGACTSRPPPLDACLAAVSYGWPWDALLARLKFADEPGWAIPMADLLRRAPGVAQALTAAHWVLPMPLAPERLAQRGYNQSLLLARALLAEAPHRLDAGLLLRVRHTAPQHVLPRRDRLRNVQGAYAVEPLRAASLRGQRVLLLDDVMTSGASLYAAAQALRQAGAAHITAMVVARTDWAAGE